MSRRQAARVILRWTCRLASGSSTSPGCELVPSASQLAARSGRHEPRETSANGLSLEPQASLNLASASSSEASCLRSTPTSSSSCPSPSGWISAFGPIPVDRPSATPRTQRCYPSFEHSCPQVLAGARKSRFRYAAIDAPGMQSRTLGASRSVSRPKRASGTCRSCSDVSRSRSGTQPSSESSSSFEDRVQIGPRFEPSDHSSGRRSRSALKSRSPRFRSAEIPAVTPSSLLIRPGDHDLPELSRSA